MHASYKIKPKQINVKDSSSSVQFYLPEITKTLLYTFPNFLSLTHFDTLVLFFLIVEMGLHHI